MNISFKKTAIYIILFAVLSFSISTAAHASEYKRIISLAPSATESLYALEMDKNIIGLTLYCPNPHNIASIGTTLEPNIEQIIYLKPDLVIACEEANSNRTIDKLISLGLNVLFIPESKNFTDICNNFRQLAKRLGRENLAEKIIAQAKKDLEVINAGISQYPQVRVFWEVGARPIITINGDSFVDEIIRFSGGINIFSDLRLKYPILSDEEIIMQNPDVILMINMGNVTDQELARWKKYKQISAVKNNRIHIIDPALVCWPIPSNFVKGVQYVSQLLHPDIIANE